MKRFCQTPHKLNLLSEGHGDDEERYLVCVICHHRWLIKQSLIMDSQVYDVRIALPEEK